jgi:hypothetical protein
MSELQISKENLLNRLRELEVSLHQPTVRSNADRLEELLHESFTEIGRSGQSYCRADIVQQLLSEEHSAVIWAQNFVMHAIGDDIALLTYKSGHLESEGDVSRHSLRSSLWQRTEPGWRLRFHQGTPTTPFAKSIN